MITIVKLKITIIDFVHNKARETAVNKLWNYLFVRYWFRRKYWLGPHNISQTLVLPGALGPFMSARVG